MIHGRSSPFISVCELWFVAAISGGALACGGSSPRATSIDAGSRMDRPATKAPAADGGGERERAITTRDASAASRCDVDLDAGCAAANSGGAPAAGAGAKPSSPPPKSAGSAAPPHQDDPPPVAQPFFATAIIEEAPSTPKLGDGDLWPSCWAADDNVYVAAGDPAAFGPLTTDIVTARIEGRQADAD